MKIDAIKLGLAAAIVIAVFWVICSLLFALMPGGMMQMRGQMVHADLGNMPWFLTWSGFFFGLLLWPIISGVTTWAIAAVYNRLLG